MKNKNIVVLDKNSLYIESLNEMAMDCHVNLCFHSLKDEKGAMHNTNKNHLLFIVYEISDLYLLLENKVDFKKVIIATKNQEVLKYLEDTFNLKYVNLNIRNWVIRNLNRIVNKNSVVIRKTSA
jgi:hypothetical protein